MAEGDKITDLTFGGIALLPSAVALGPGGQVLTGWEALDQAQAHPCTALRMPKRAVAAGASVRLDRTSVPVAGLVAAVLDRVRAEAVRCHSGVAPREVIMCHPAAWTDAELGEIAAAGLPELVFVPEPIAAARHFLMGCPGPDCGQDDSVDIAADSVAVFDFGVGLDIALLRRDGDQLKVIGQSGGDAELGGDDLDERMMDLLADRAYQADPLAWDAISSTDPKPAPGLAPLRRQVSGARETLSSLLYADIAVPGFAAPFRITRREFDAAALPDLDRAAALAETAITMAGLALADVSVALAGAVSRTPAVSDVLAARFGTLPLTAPDPKATVAHGALLAAAGGPDGRERYLVFDPANHDWLDT
jgi:molecular chaperone DnaK (HSP70)